MFKKNMFVCNELDVDDDEEEPEPAKDKTKEGPSLRELMAGIECHFSKLIETRQEGREASTCSI
jgi:hypothetical protein